MSIVADKQSSKKKNIKDKSVYWELDHDTNGEIGNITAKARTFTTIQETNLTQVLQLMK